MSEKQYVLPIPSKRGVMFFLIANVLAFALCGAVWALVWYGDFFSPAAGAVWAFLAEHSGWTVGAALRIRPGFSARFAIFDDDFNVSAVVVDGVLYPT